MRADKRRRIVETAYPLFLQDGYHAVGIDRIIADSGVAKMTLYRHFGAKDELIVAVLRLRSEHFEARLDTLLDSLPTAGARIAAIVDWYGRWFAQADFRGCAFAHALAEFGDPSHPVFQAALAQKDAFRERLQRILSAETEPEQASRTAAILAMLFEGAALRAQMGRVEEAMEALREGARTLLAQAGVAA